MDDILQKAVERGEEMSLLVYLRKAMPCNCSSRKQDGKHIPLCPVSIGREAAKEIERLREYIESLKKPHVGRDSSALVRELREAIEDLRAAMRQARQP